MRTAIALTCAALASADGAGSTQAKEPLRVQYVPQVQLQADGVPDLPMANRLARWAQQAGLSLHWEAVPLKRSLQELKANREPLCVLGAFRTPERQGYARFSLPIFQEEQQLFIAALRVAAQLRALPDARAAVMDTRLRLLVFDGVAYGQAWDRWIAERPEPPLRASAGSARLLPMLARGHADFTISVPSELQQLQAAGDPDAGSVETVSLPGLPPAPRRHLACSLRVPADWLARIDAAIRTHPVP
jgi:hypothetical protein